jgi:hypothetical protein
MDRFRVEGMGQTIPFRFGLNGSDCFAAREQQIIGFAGFNRASESLLRVRRQDLSQTRAEQSSRTVGGGGQSAAEPFVLGSWVGGSGRFS